jgi:Tol biopolymer transport system component
MKKIGIDIIGGIALIMVLLCLVVPVKAQDSGQAAAVEYVKSDRWVSSVRGVPEQTWITVHDGDSLIHLTQGRNDHKPSWSKEGDMLTWFRWETNVKQGMAFNLHNAICVIKIDGTGFRELTDFSHSNYNPTWTRDGSNKIIFTRVGSNFRKMEIYMIDPEGPKNSEVMITSPKHKGLGHYEWSESGLKDGRIFIWRVHPFKSAINLKAPRPLDNAQTWHLFDPDTQTYEDLSRPSRYPVHKLSVTPSETKVVYMKAKNHNPFSYNHSVIAYAELDLANMEVKNEVEISPYDSSYTDMYPRWAPDEMHIMYSSSRSGKMQQYLYNLETKETHMVTDAPNGDMYPCFEDMPK